MLTNVQLEKYADVLLWGLTTARSGRFRKNDIVLIRGDLGAVKLIHRLQAKILDMGMHPVVRLGLTSEMEKTFYEKANHKQLVFEAPGAKELHKKINGSLYLFAPESLTHLSGIDPKKIAKAAVARKPLRDLLRKREEKGVFGWTLCMLPTPELAKHARLSMRQYTNQVIKACYLDQDDPVQAWKSIYRNAMAVKKWINSMDVEYYHIESRSIDLRITPGKRRRWLGISGHNIPSFELFVSPDWRGTEGIYFANQPSFRNGNRVEGIRLEFKKGKAIKVKARKGEDFAIKQLSMDKGAKQIGEFSLTDKRFSKIDKFMANTLFDENHGGRYGNCHIALGASYSDTYDGDPSKLTEKKKKEVGLNDSALHWDLVNTEKKTVTAHLTSGKRVTVYDDGMFKC
ncbi:MAG: aminopeptidase [Deltaproteobacteria bacterium]|nr:aminopeptidase [Deltaproteobacteria bacterium]MBW1859773.1 aminopeptidase [Deltaproteobacteria bacterium]